MKISGGGAGEQRGACQHASLSKVERCGDSESVCWGRREAAWRAGRQGGGLGVRPDPGASPFSPDKLFQI